MGQTSYSIDIPAVSYPGQIADAMRATDIKTAAAVASALPYGVCVVRDEANTGDFSKLAAKLPSTGTDVTAAGSVMGIVLADQARAQDPSVAVAQYPLNSAVSVMAVGRVWVSSETAVVDGQPVFVRVSANGPLTQLGALRADADGGHAVQLPDAIWIGTTAAAGYAVAELAVL